MELVFKESFARDLRAVTQKSVLHRIREVIDAVANANDLQSVPNLRKLNDPGNYYRIRVGDYRLGINRGPVQVFTLFSLNVCQRRRKRRPVWPTSEGAKKSLRPVRKEAVEILHRKANCKNPGLRPERPVHISVKGRRRKLKERARFCTGRTGARRLHCPKPV